MRVYNTLSTINRELKSSKFTSKVPLPIWLASDLSGTLLEIRFRVSKRITIWPLGNERLYIIVWEGPFPPQLLILCPILDHRLDLVCRMSLSKPVSFSIGKKKAEITPRKHFVSLAQVLLRKRHLLLAAAETDCLARKSSRLIRNSHFLYPFIMLCPLTCSGLKLEVFQQLNREGSRRAVSWNNVERYLAGFKTSLHEPWQIICWDRKDGKGHHPKRSPWFPMLLWTTFRSIYCCMLLCFWLNHNLSKMHSLFCTYQHINFQLCDTRSSSISTQEKKTGFLFTADVGKSLFFLEEMILGGEIDFLFYWEFSVHMEGRRKKGNVQMHEGIKVTAGESVRQGITNYRISSLKAELNRTVWNNEAKTPSLAYEIWKSIRLICLPI